MTIRIDEPVTGLAAECEPILRALPDWFGIEQSIVQYVRDIEQLPTIIARDADGSAIGFMSIKQHFPRTAELYVLGVRAEDHRRGVGRAMLAKAEQWLAARGVHILQVKTVSASRQCEAYARTREFYEAVGFVPLEEFPKLWDVRNPCLIMVKGLNARADSHRSRSAATMRDASS